MLFVQTIKSLEYFVAKNIFIRQNWFYKETFLTGLNMLKASEITASECKTLSVLLKSIFIIYQYLIFIVMKVLVQLWYKILRFICLIVWPLSPCVPIGWCVLVFRAPIGWCVLISSAAMGWLGMSPCAAIGVYIWCSSAANGGWVLWSCAAIGGYILSFFAAIGGYILSFFAAINVCALSSDAAISGYILSSCAAIRWSCSCSVQ